MNCTLRSNTPVVENLEARTMMSAVPLGVSEVAFDGGTQLRITGTAGNDQITVTQTATGLVIGNTGGWSRTVSDPIKSLWINGEAGNNSVVLDASVKIDATVFGGGVNDSLVAGGGNDTLYGGTGKNLLQAGAGNDTLVSLGSKADTLVGGTGNDSFWTDNNAAEKIQNLSAQEIAAGNVHRVGGIYNAASVKVAGKKVAAAKAMTVSTGTTVKEPGVDAGVSYASFSSDPIFSDAGPSADDINQGNVGDCYFLSVLSSTARIDPAKIRQSILDMGDGTVIVQFNKGGKPVFVREDEQLPVNGDGSLAYAGLGAGNSTWVALMEKAFTYVRTNSVNYDAIDSGWMDETYRALGATPTSTYSAASASALLNLIAKDLNAGLSVTYATTDTPGTATLVADHAYSVVSVTTDSKGNATSLTLRNPWGCGADLTGNGYVTISAAQALKAMTGMVSAAV